MMDRYWENGEWKAWYMAVDTPFGTLTRLVPGSLTRKGDVRPPGRAEDSEAKPPGESGLKERP